MSYARLHYATLHIYLYCIALHYLSSYAIIPYTSLINCIMFYGTGTCRYVLMYCKLYATLCYTPLCQIMPWYDPMRCPALHKTMLRFEHFNTCNHWSFMFCELCQPVASACQHSIVPNSIIPFLCLCPVGYFVCKIKILHVVNRFPICCFWQIRVMRISHKLPPSPSSL